jgi:HPt (histidine-containing phosphotransfer) domain-containing protein
MMTPLPPSPIDWKVLKDWEEAGSETGTCFLHDVLRLFLETTPSLIDEIRHGARSKNTAALKTLSHRLKGSCVNLGFTELAALSDTIETAARQNSVALESTEKLPEAFQTIKVAVEGILPVKQSASH